MKSYVAYCKQAIILSLILAPSPALALFGQGTDQSNVGTDWSNTDKNISTTGDITGDDINATGKITPSSEGVLYNQGGANAVDTTIETKLSTQLVNVSDWASLATAITDIGSTPTTLTCNGTITIPDGTTPTLNLNTGWSPQPGCTVQGVVGGGTETLVVPYLKDPGILNWIGANVTVTFGDSVTKVIPDWWAVNTDPGTTEMGTAVQAAITAAGAEIPVEFYGKYLCSTTVNFNPYGHYRGIVHATLDRADSSGLVSGVTSADASFTLDGDTDASSIGYNPTINDMTFQRLDYAGPLFYMRDIKRGKVNGSTFIGGSANLLMDAGASGTWYNDFNDCTFLGDRSGTNSYHGIDILTTGAGHVNNNKFIGCNLSYQGTNIRVNDGAHNIFAFCSLSLAWELGIDLPTNASSSHHEFIGVHNEQNQIRDYASGGRLISNNQEYTKVNGGQWLSSILTTDQYVEDTATNKLSMLGDIQNLNNQHILPVKLASVLPKLSFDTGADEISISMFGDALRFRDETTADNKLTYDISADLWVLYKDMMIGGADNPQITSYAGTPEAGKASKPGSICLNTKSPLGSGEYAVYIKRTGTGTTGWEGLGTVIP